MSWSDIARLLGRTVPDGTVARVCPLPRRRQAAPKKPDEAANDGSYQGPQLIGSYAQASDRGTSTVPRSSCGPCGTSCWSATLTDPNGGSQNRRRSAVNGPPLSLNQPCLSVMLGAGHSFRSRLIWARRTGAAAKTRAAASAAAGNRRGGSRMVWRAIG
jgi:hypothetical protein